jgi:hypothetical protein
MTESDILDNVNIILQFIIASVAVAAYFKYVQPKDLEDLHKKIIFYRDMAIHFKLEAFSKNRNDLIITRSEAFKTLNKYLDSMCLDIGKIEYFFESNDIRGHEPLLKTLNEMRELYIKVIQKDWYENFIKEEKKGEYVIYSTIFNFSEERKNEMRELYNEFKNRKKNLVLEFTIL